MNEPARIDQPVRFPGSICIRQRILPQYRATFFDLLADRCDGELWVVAGAANATDSADSERKLQVAKLAPVVNKKSGAGVFTRYTQLGLLEHLQKHAPDVFVTVPNPRLRDMKKVVRHVRSSGIPAIGWGIGMTEFWNKPLARLRRMYRERFVQQFDGMLCYGSRAARQYEQIGFPASRLHPIYNATIAQPGGECPQRPITCAGPLKILNVGRLIESKGVDRLIEASAILKSKGIEVEIQIVGDGEDAPRLKRLADELEAPVVFAGRQSGEALRKFGLEADLFVLPGLGGLAIQEAMSFGLPVIVTEADGTEDDLVRDNGWIVEKENVNALADCIESAVGDVTALRKMGEESWRIVQEEINLERMADRFIEGVLEIQKKGLRS